MASPSPSSPAPPKPPKPPPLPQPRTDPTPSLAHSIGSPSGPNQIVLPDDVEESPIPRRDATRPLSSNLESPSPSTTSRRSAPRISTANAIAATRDIKKRWCGAHDAAANGDLLRLKAYIDASDGSPKRNVPRRAQQPLARVTVTRRRCTTNRNSAPIPSSPRLRAGTYQPSCSCCRQEAPRIKPTLKSGLPCTMRVMRRVKRWNSVLFEPLIVENLQ